MHWSFPGVALRWAPGCACSLAAALLVSCTEASDSRGTREPPPVDVRVVKAEPTSLPRTLSSVGSLESPDMTTVASEIEGRVVEVDIPEGRRVEGGHVLVRLDDAEARASLAVTRARLQNARDRLRRLESLRAQSVSSEQAYDDAKSEFEAAEGAYDEARTRLEKTTVFAPFAGVLGLRQVHRGQYVEGGTPIVELTRVDPLELVFSLPQRFVADLAMDQKVLGVVGACGPRFEGRVNAIDPRVDPATRSVRLQALVPNPDGVLYPGMAVRVRLFVGNIPDALVVPQEAIVRQGTKHMVYTLDEENRARQHTVTLGQFFVDGVHVRDGITAHSRVVVAGQQKLRPGSPALPSPHEPTDNPNLALGRYGPVGQCEPPG